MFVLKYWLHKILYYFILWTADISMSSRPFALVIQELIITNNYVITYYYNIKQEPIIVKVSKRPWCDMDQTIIHGTK